MLDNALFLSYRLILTEREFLMNIIPLCLMLCGIILWIAAGSFLIINTFHYTPIMFGVFQIFIFGSFIIGTQATKYLVEKIELEKLLNDYRLMPVGSSPE